MLSLMRLPRRSTRRHWTELGEHRVAIVSSAAPIRGHLRLPPDASLNDRPMKRWVGLGIIADNLINIGRFAVAQSDA